MKKKKCKHEIKYRQAVACGLDSLEIAPYGVICLKCGFRIFQGKLDKSEVTDWGGK